MKRIKPLDEVYKQCVKQGLLISKKEANYDKAKTLQGLAKFNYESSLKITLILENSKNYGMLWSINYEIIRQLVQGLLVFDNIKSRNHQCLLAYMCKNYRIYGIDWKIIETMRQLRNKSHYEGKLINVESWNEYKPKFSQYINRLMELLIQKLSSS